ncbi:MAG: hypothetical protein V7L29_01690 [Nostoc sp.]|uniref:hypothetical protein n=1 Tax=Nostoc sp. TaxID=1180 RepID=UPI002FF63BD2
MEPTINSIFNCNQPMAIAVVKPSSWLKNGIQVEKANNLNLFKFTDELQARMQELVDRKTADSLTPEEAAEMEAIGELIIIVSYINGMIASEAQKFQGTGNSEQGTDKN